MDPYTPRNNHQFNPNEPHPELDDIDISEFDNMDWVNNPDPFGMFAAQGVPTPRMVTPSDAQRQAREKSARIFANFRVLQGVLHRHEAKIQKRWEKKKRSQRLAILLDAWPNMSPTHRPDFAAFRRSDKSDRSAYMWPYINQEDLAKTQTLPLLLNARGRHHPSVFSAADGDAMALGKVAMALVAPFLNCYIMLLNGQMRQEDYGRILNWDDHKDAFSWMSTRKQFLPGEGLLILEAQDRLLDFLVSCCYKILHEIPAKDITDSEIYPLQPEPPRSRVKGEEIAESGLITSLTAMAEEGPYRPPLKLDFERMESLLAARTALAEDHIWALREDPSYFAETLLEMREHRQEMIIDIAGNVHPTLKPERENVLWSRIISTVVLEAYLHLDLFAELHRQAKHLRVLKAKYEKQIKPLEDLPEEYIAALLKFRHYLNQTAKGPLDQLKLTVAASPGFRHYFVRQVPESATSSMIGWLQKPGVRMDDVAFQLTWLLRTLWEDGRDLLFCRFTTVVDELDRYLEAEPKAAALVSPYIASRIGDLSILSECLKQIENYQPWANGYVKYLVDREEDIKKDFAASHTAQSKIRQSLRPPNVLPISHLGDPSQKKFDYPVGKRHNQANTQRLRESEANLDNFWAAIDKLILQKVGDLKGTHLGSLLSDPRALQRTPEWVEPTKVNGKSKTEVPEHMISRPISSIYYFDTPSSAPTSGRKEALAAAEMASKTTKSKTRGVPSTSTQDVISPSSSSQVLSPEPQPIIPVDARTLKVFRILFFKPSPHASAGEVAWADFLHAMASTGFAAQKLYGSVWHFQPSGIDLERSIQFHEPHPHSVPCRETTREEAEQGVRMVWWDVRIKGGGSRECLRLCWLGAGGRRQNRTGECIL